MRQERACVSTILMFWRNVKETRVQFPLDACPHVEPSTTSSK